MFLSKPKSSYTIDQTRPRYSEPFLFRTLLDQSRKNTEFIDIQLKIGDKFFAAHRNIISLYSPVLKAIMSEQCPRGGICEIDNVDAETMELLLSYFYTGKLELTPNNVYPVCVAAHSLQISALLYEALHYLCQQVTVNNVLNVFEFAVRCDLPDLSKHCLCFLKTENSNFLKYVFQGSQILELSFHDFNELILGLKEPFRGSLQKEQTFDCVVRWVERNLPERLGQLPVLLKNVPLEHLEFGFLAQTVSNHLLVKESISCIHMVTTVLENYQAPEQAKPSFIVLGGYNCGEVYDSAQSYDWSTGLWQKFPQMLTPRMDFAATIINRRNILVCGGFTRFGNHCTSDFDMYDGNREEWVPLKNIPHPRAGLSMAVHKGKVYVTGGLYRQKHLDKVLCYSFETGFWEPVMSMNEKRAYGQLIAYKDHLYAIGGMTNTVERYDPIRDEWRMMASMNKCQSYLSATIHDDKIYVCCSKGFEVYDPETNVWTTLQDSLSVEETCLVSINGKLLAVGGKHQNESKDTVKEFDFETNKWLKFCDMDSELFSHCVVVGDF